MTPERLAEIDRATERAAKNVYYISADHFNELLAAARDLDAANTALAECMAHADAMAEDLKARGGYHYAGAYRKWKGEKL